MGTIFLKCHRELDLRGYKFNQIENLGATLDQFDRKCFWKDYTSVHELLIEEHWNGFISIKKYDDE